MPGACSGSRSGSHRRGARSISSARRCGATAGCSPPTRTAARTSTPISTTTPSCSLRCSSCCRSAFDAADLAFARELADVLLEQFEDAEAGGFFFTAHDHEQLMHRPKPGARQRDAVGQRGRGLGRWGALRRITGEERYARAAERTLELFYPQMRDYPAGFAAMAIALDEAAPAAAHADPARRGRGAARAGRPSWRRSSCRTSTVLAIPDGTPGAAGPARQARAGRSLSTHGYAAALLVLRR